MRGGRPWPRVLRYIVCGHYHAADTGKRMKEGAALRDLDGVKEILSQCPECATPVKRLPPKDYWERP
jgi:hypothetical protein